MGKLGFLRGTINWLINLNEHFKITNSLLVKIIRNFEYKFMKFIAKLFILWANFIFVIFCCRFTVSVCEVSFSEHYNKCWEMLNYRLKIIFCHLPEVVQQTINHDVISIRCGLTHPYKIACMIRIAFSF